MKRENFASRLGFLLVSAGCAVGIGNVWRFPTVAGENGGGVFVLFYLLFLITMGVPVLSMELAVGRGGRGSAGKALRALEPKGSRWHLHGWVCLVGCTLLMMYYTVVSGWMVSYFFKFASGTFDNLDMADTARIFGEMLASPGEMLFWMAVMVAAGFAVCSMGLQNGIERITKWMMGALLVLIVVLAVHSFTLPNAGEGLAFFLLPDWGRAMEKGLGSVVLAAMTQSFFTLGLGLGSMGIFGSYMSRDKSIPGEAVRICGLDTFVAVCAGLIIFPACYAFGVSPDAGPSLIFITLPNVFTGLPAGRLWGSLFFIFMVFASFSTVIAVFENILACLMDAFGLSRKKASLAGALLLLAGCVPCILGFNLWAGFQPLGAGSTVLDLEDFVVSNLLLPAGSMLYLLFCVTRWGWGFDGYLAECNAGAGIRFPRWFGWVFRVVLPALILIVLVSGLV